jgi:ketosteroid isomerase-like protein
MSQENVEVVRRIWRIWEEGAETGDPEALEAVFREGLLSPDSKFRPLQEVAGASGTTYVGLDGLREFVRAWSAAWVDWRITLEETIDAADDQVVAVIRQSATGRGSGARVTVRFAMVFTFRGGQVIDRRDYLDLSDALEAAGRSQ